MEVVDQLAPAARVGPVQLDIHHRFAPALVVAQRLERLEYALLVAIDANHGVEQPMDRQMMPANGIGDRIDQEGHVVVDDAEAHPPPAGLAAG